MLRTEGSTSLGTSRANVRSEVILRCRRIGSAVSSGRAVAPSLAHFVVVTKGFRGRTGPDAPVVTGPGSEG